MSGLVLDQQGLGDALDGDAQPQRCPIARRGVHHGDHQLGMGGGEAVELQHDGFCVIARKAGCCEGPRGGVGAKIRRLRCGQRVTARKLENPFSHTYPLCKSFGFADREKYV